MKLITLLIRFVLYSTATTVFLKHHAKAFITTTRKRPAAEVVCLLSTKTNDPNNKDDHELTSSETKPSGSNSNGISRRNILLKGGGNLVVGGTFLGAGSISSGGKVKDAQACTTSAVADNTAAPSSSLMTSEPSSTSETEFTISPLADIPMVRLRLPPGGVGREYVAIQLTVKGKGPYDFMVDTGLTTELITPHLQHTLGIVNNKSNKVSGLGAGGGTDMLGITDLDGAALCCGNFADASGTKKDGLLPLPKLHAVIADFPQEHMDPSHDPVEGMIGMELLSLFDVDFDFLNNRIRFWKPGTANTKGLVEIPAVVINETGLIGIRVSVVGAKQPVLGLLDCGSTFSCMNWKAATIFGLPSKGDPSYNQRPSIAALGVDGRPLLLPTMNMALTFAGGIQLDPQSGRPVGFESPPTIWKPWDPVQLAVGDIPAFNTVLGNGVAPYDGPAVLIGLDILAQRRVILQASQDISRRRRVFVSPS